MDTDPMIILINPLAPVKVSMVDTGSKIKKRYKPNLKIKIYNDGENIGNTACLCKIFDSLKKLIN